MSSKNLESNGTQCQITFAVKLNKEFPITKQQILSEATRLYEPLGWLSPTTIQLESFIQLMWTDKTCRIKRYQSHYRNIMDAFGTVKNLQLHVFCDASTTIYAAVVYMRQKTSEGTTNVDILTAKTRVAPIACTCVPRMELCAALLGSKLVEATLAAISDQRFIIPTVFVWNDSQVIIAWLKEFPRKWKTLVANRIAKIEETLPAERWKFVPTKAILLIVLLGEFHLQLYHIMNFGGTDQHGTHSHQTSRRE